MKRLVGAAAITLALLAVGCCGTRDPSTGVSVESYKKAVTQIHDNLKTVVKPAMEAALAESKKSDKWKEAQLGVVIDSITLCEDTLAGKNAGVAPVRS